MSLWHSAYFTLLLPFLPVKKEKMNNTISQKLFLYTY